MPAIQTRAIPGARISFSPALKSGPFQKPVLRRPQRVFRAPSTDGPYRLPKAACDRLETSLAAFRNAEAAFALALFLGRFWSSEKRLEMPFPIDRRALAQHQALDLSEAEIRGAIQTLERIGFLERALLGAGSRYRATAEGLKRKAILFEFGCEFAAVFKIANRKARRAFSERPRTLLPARQRFFLEGPSQRHFPHAAPVTPHDRSPKCRISLETRVIMGEFPNQDVGEETPLEKALAVLGRAIGLSVNA